MKTTHSDALLITAFILATALPSQAAIFQPPAGGWTYVYTGDAAANNSTAALDGTWNHNNSSDEWDTSGRGAGRGAPGGVSSTIGFLTIEDASTATTGSSNNRHIYFTRDLAQDGVSASNLLDTGITLSFRARLTPSDALAEIPLPDGYGIFSSGKGMFGVFQSSPLSLISFSLVRASEDGDPAIPLNFASAGLTLNRNVGDAPNSDFTLGQGVNSSTTAADNPILPLDPTAFHEFWITIQANDATPGNGTHTVNIWVDGSVTPTPFNITAGVGNVLPTATSYLAMGLSSSATIGAFDVDYFAYKPGLQTPMQTAPSIANPSFEADTFTVFPGYVGDNGPITGWSSPVGDGVNPGTFGGPFTDNGAIPDGTKAAFLQQDGAFSQIIHGFTMGLSYRVRYFENARNCCSGTSPFCEVRLGGATVVAAHAVSPVGGSSPYREVLSDPSTATGTSMLLEFIKSNPQGGDTTLLIDNVSIIAPNKPPSITTQPQDAIVAIGDTAIFTVGGTGTPPLTYQWYFNNGRITAATSTTLGVLADSPAVAGAHYAVVSNAFGSTTSRVARLTIGTRIAGLFDTGVDDNSNALANGAVDPHYRLVINADGPSMNAIVEDSTAFPIIAGPWVANTPTSKWIGPRLNTADAAGLAQGGGIYVYRIIFDLTGLDRSLVRITGSWGVDNEGLNIRVNGAPTGLVNNNGFTSLTQFTIETRNATFVDGLNTLDFEVRNGDATTGYTGLRVANLRGLGGTLPPAPQDFGDAPFPYPTLLALNGARHTIVDGFRLGTSVDAEADGQPNASATGDDLGGTDDEGGVTFTTALIVGQTATIQVNASAVGKLDAWIDFNADGDWADAGEQIFTSQALVAGNNALNFPVPATAMSGPTFARFRFSSAGGLAFNGPASDGEVEDYVVPILGRDFGDVPAPYPTLLANNGARHTIVAGFRLGTSVDAEADGQPNATAAGDDLVGTDDEDGVTFNTPLIQGQAASVTVTASAAGKLDGWIDFNSDGDWADMGEQIFASQPLIAGDNPLNFTVPAAATPGPTFARFRFSSTGGLSFTGAAIDGEVEDYQLVIQQSPLAALKVASVYIGGQTIYSPVFIINDGLCIAYWCWRLPRWCFSRVYFCPNVDRFNQLIEVPPWIPVTPWMHSAFAPAKCTYFEDTIRCPELGHPAQLGPRPSKPSPQNPHDMPKVPLEYGLSVRYSDDQGRTFRQGTDFSSAFFAMAEAITIAVTNQNTNAPPGPPPFAQFLQELGQGYPAAGLELASLITEVNEVNRLEPRSILSVISADLQAMRSALQGIGNQLNSGSVSNPTPLNAMSAAMASLAAHIRQLPSARFANPARNLGQMASAFQCAADSVRGGLNEPTEVSAFVATLYVDFRTGLYHLATGMMPHMRVQVDLGPWTWYPATVDAVEVRIQNRNTGEFFDQELMGGTFYPLSNLGEFDIPLFTGEGTPLRIWLKMPTYLSRVVDVQAEDGLLIGPLAAIPGDANGDNCVDGLDLQMVQADQGKGRTEFPPPSDVNGNGMVDTNDLNVVQANLGRVGDGYRPVLAATRAGTNVVLSWCDPSHLFALQSATQLSVPPASILWSDVNVPIVTVAARKTATVSTRGRSQFFLLSEKQPAFFINLLDGSFAQIQSTATNEVEPLGGFLGAVAVPTNAPPVGSNFEVQTMSLDLAANLPLGVMRFELLNPAFLSVHPDGSAVGQVPFEVFLPLYRTTYVVSATLRLSGTPYPYRQAALDFVLQPGLPQLRSQYNIHCEALMAQEVPCDRSKTLIDQLDDADITVRDQAQSELFKIGRSALDKLQKALQAPGTGAEQAARLRNLISGIIGVSTTRCEWIGDGRGKYEFDFTVHVPDNGEAWTRNVCDLHFQVGAPTSTLDHNNSTLELDDIMLRDGWTGTYDQAQGEYRFACDPNDPHSLIPCHPYTIHIMTPSTLVRPQNGGAPKPREIGWYWTDKDGRRIGSRGTTKGPIFD